MNPVPISLLIVDDDPVFARLVLQLVQSLGSELTCISQVADTAGKALAELARNAYELVLLDYNLPDGDGLQVLAQIRTLAPDQQPAVIMLTASGSEAVAVEAMKRGAKDYLTKANLDVASLMRAVQSALAQKRLAAQVAAYHTQMEAELQMARKLQQSLFPDRYPVFPRAGAPDQSALQFCHRFYPAMHLAGDFFSVLKLSDTRAAVFLCDVMGHGVRSALVTAMMRAWVDDLASESTDPAEFLGELNRRLARVFRQSDGSMFATAFYLVTDLAAGEIHYANAGHPRPLHFHHADGLVSPLTLPPHPGPALGLFEDAKYLCAQGPLLRGDRLLLFTDGLFEVMDAAGQFGFGQDRLLEAARARMGLPAADLLDGLVAEARAFSGGAEFSDDVCLLALEVTT